ncbi:MAG: hypothetical protein ACTHK4_15860 [Mycobacteriales bacterium]
MRRVMMAVAALVLSVGPGALPPAGATPSHAGARGSRPPAEHIPATVDHARIDYVDTHDASRDQHIRLRGKRARHLVALFDELKREPSGTAQCEIATSSHTMVTFRGPNHS